MLIYAFLFSQENHRFYQVIDKCGMIEGPSLGGNGFGHEPCLFFWCVCNGWVSFVYGNSVKKRREKNSVKIMPFFNVFDGIAQPNSVGKRGDKGLSHVSSRYTIVLVYMISMEQKVWALRKEGGRRFKNSTA